MAGCKGSDDMVVLTFTLGSTDPKRAEVKYRVNDRPAGENRKDWRWRKVIAAAGELFAPDNYEQIADVVLEQGLELQAITPEHPLNYEKKYIKERIYALLIDFFRKDKSSFNHFEYLTLAGVPYLSAEESLSLSLEKYFYCLLYFDIAEFRSDREWVIDNIFLPCFKRQRDIRELEGKLLPYEYGDMLIGSEYTFDSMLEAKKAIKWRLWAALSLAKLMQEANPCTDVERIALEIYFNCRDIPIKELPDKIEELLPEEIFKEWVAGVRRIRCSSP